MLLELCATSWVDFTKSNWMISTACVAGILSSSNAFWTVPPPEIETSSFQSLSLPVQMWRSDDDATFYNNACFTVTNWTNPADMSRHIFNWNKTLIEECNYIRLCLNLRIWLRLLLLWGQILCFNVSSCLNQAASTNSDMDLVYCLLVRLFLNPSKSNSWNCSLFTSVDLLKVPSMAGCREKKMLKMV